MLISGWKVTLILLLIVNNMKQRVWMCLLFLCQGIALTCLDYYKTKVTKSQLANV